MLGRGLTSRLPVALGFLFLSFPALFAQQDLGRIVGQVRVSKGDFPPHAILVELTLHGSTISSVYADDQGRFGFYGLEANTYHVVIHDPAFREVDELANVNPILSSLTMLQIQLDPRSNAVPGVRSAGGNPDLVDASDYARFPKNAIKEFDRGVEADRTGRRDDALRHYKKAIDLAPDFYKAHNNLGSYYLSKADFSAARQEFEQATRLNQSDAAAYFNLSNVCMQLGELPAAQHYLAEGLQRQPDAALGHFLQGTLQLHMGNLSQAEGSLRRAIALDPLMAQPRLQLVKVLLQEGRKADAVGHLHDFVRSYPDGPFSAQAKDLLKRLEASAPPPQPVSR